MTQRYCKPIASSCLSVEYVAFLSAFLVQSRDTAYDVPVVHMAEHGEMAVPVFVISLQKVGIPLQE